jgi:predicted ATPase
MRLSSFAIHNYKSFKDSPRINFSSGFNVVVGQNNVGKSALLEALSLKFLLKPHKSLLTAPSSGTRLYQNSWAEVMFTLTGEELRHILLNNFDEFTLPLPKREQYRDGQSGLNLLLDELFGQDEISFDLRMDTDKSPQEAKWMTAGYPSLVNVYESEVGSENGRPYMNVHVSPGEPRFNFINKSNGRDEGDFGLGIASVIRSRVYSFHAQRLINGVSAFGANRTLAPNAANLPEVLSVLQGRDPALFDEFNTLVRQVFRSIYRVSIINQNQNSLEIVLWMEDPRNHREDLTISLSESGTGVGQVLAILYVALTSQFSTTILIDEPNSFLHPSAARKLIEILQKNFSQHQYIVTTHSPEIIRAANAGTLTLIKWEKPQSVIEQLNAKEVRDAQKCLTEVGARLSDVFGADEILWVEGQTEEECFRLILNQLGKLPVLGLSVVAVRNTGDFESKRGYALIWEIYERLSRSNALLPQGVAFIFDREGRTEKDMEDLKRRSDGRVRFLPRRMYENYLIWPEALHAVMADLETFRENPIAMEKIIEWLTDNGGKPEYIPGGHTLLDLGDPDWLTKVDAAKLLQKLFEALSGSKEEYRKTVHSVQLTEWLIENKPSALAEILEFLQAILAPMTGRAI